MYEGVPIAVKVISLIFGVSFFVLVGFLYWVYIRSVLRLRVKSKLTKGLMLFGSLSHLFTAAIYGSSTILVPVEKRLALGTVFLTWTYGLFSLTKGINGREIGLGRFESRITTSTGWGALLFGILVGSYYVLH
jgi:hypothetical protein